MAPHDYVAWRWVLGACEIATEPSDFDEVSHPQIGGGTSHHGKSETTNFIWLVFWVMSVPRTATLERVSLIDVQLAIMPIV